MTDYPIIFSAPMVRALLEGRKTMTRRLAFVKWKEFPEIGQRLKRRSPWTRVKPGDRLYVRENFSYQEISGDRIEQYGGVHYWADGNPTFGNWTRPKPSIHMPRVVSRLTLIITTTKIEPLQNISEADAIAEGIMPHVRGGWHWHKHDPANVDDWHQFGFKTCAFAFMDLWQRLHGDESWNANPHVVALSFRVEKINIDQLQAVAA